jgi:ATP-dependent Clp protease ATP-binding subunit ClpC
MFERFTERARQVVVLAQDEARELRHNYIGTEHLLLGLLREEDGLGARVLGELGVTLEGVRSDVGLIIGQGDEAMTGQIPFTPRAKRVLELSLNEATELGHGYIGTEHLLLGLAREGNGVAARILADHGAPPERIAGAVLEKLQGGRGRVDPEFRQRFVEQPRVMTRVFTATPARRVPKLPPFARGWLLGAVTLGVGILVGWAIWGH